MTENETNRRYKLKEVCIRLAEGIRFIRMSLFPLRLQRLM